MTTNKISIFFVILFASFSQLVCAKTSKNQSELIVEADDSLEWFEKEKYYMAKGNVILKKDSLTLKANIVKAHYVFKNGENILKKIMAKENVILTKKHTKATGQYMTYDLENKIARLLGPLQTLTSPSGYLEAKKIIVFDDLRNKADAEGNVKIILSNNTIIYADNIKADFEPNKKTLKKAIAKGNVIIENKIKRRKSKADLGVYNSNKELVELSGNVEIINQNSKVSGSKGVTNLNTNVSNIIGDPKNKKRVKGTFAPIKTNK